MGRSAIDPNSGQMEFTLHFVLLLHFNHTPYCALRQTA